MGGKLLDVRRSTLTSAKNSMLAALFSGRWEKALPRDASGRIFIDDNPVCFQKMVEALQIRKIARADDKVESPAIEEDQAFYFSLMVDRYGLGRLLYGSAWLDVDSTVLLRDPEHRRKLKKEWVTDDVRLELLYRWVVCLFLGGLSHRSLVSLWTRRASMSRRQGFEGRLRSGGLPSPLRRPRRDPDHHPVRHQPLRRLL